MQSDVGELEDAAGWDRELHMRFRIALQGDAGLPAGRLSMVPG